MEQNETSLSQALASPSEVELKGKKYKIGKLELGDWADFEEWIKQQRINRLLEGAKNTFGDKIPKEILDRICKPMILEEKDIEKEAESMQSACFLVWRAMIKYQPDMTIEDVKSLIDLDNISIITAIITDEKPEETEKKTTPPADLKVPTVTPQ